MKNTTSVNEYSEAAFEWDEWYSKLHNLEIWKGAIRVEQGEYTVVSCDKPIGTYNVRQCIVVYLATKEMHGLAHVDGHTEIKSLKTYLDALNITIENPLINIRIIGASSTTVMGLNNSEENIRKISEFLKGFLDISKIESLIKDRDNNIDFIIQHPGKIQNKYIPIGTYDKEQALHTIQEIKRIDKYSGTYPIIRANDDYCKSVFLDERAIIKLTEYIKNIDKDKKRSNFDTNNYKAFDAAIPIILEEWKKSAGNLSNVFKISTITPLFIGEDSNKLNEESLLQSKSYTNSANIDLVLKYCSNVDVDLDLKKIKEILFSKYKSDFDHGILEYDATVKGNTLLNIIFNNSTLLNKLMMLNSQGASDLNGNRYKIQDIKVVLNEEELFILKNIIEHRNTELLNIDENPVSKEQYNQFISMQFQSREKPLSRKEKIFLTQGNKDTGSYIQDFCKNYKFDFSQVSDSIRIRCKEYKNIQINKNKITDQSDFYCVQSEFLNALKVNNFSDISIGMYLSEVADNFLYVCDKDFAHKLSTIIGDYETYFSEYNEKIIEAQNIELYDNTYADNNYWQIDHLKILGMSLDDLINELQE